MQRMHDDGFIDDDDRDDDDAERRLFQEAPRLKLLGLDKLRRLRLPKLTKPS